MMAVPPNVHLYIKVVMSYPSTYNRQLTSIIHRRTRAYAHTGLHDIYKATASLTASSFMSSDTNGGVLPWGGTCSNIVVLSFEPYHGANATTCQVSFLKLLTG